MWLNVSRMVPNVPGADDVSCSSERSLQNERSSAVAHALWRNVSMSASFTTESVEELAKRRSSVLDGEAEAAAGDDVALNLACTGADGVDHAVAVVVLHPAVDGG